MKSSQEDLNITIYDRKILNSTQIQPDYPTIYLGFTSQINGKQTAQTSISNEKANKLGQKLTSYYMRQYYGYIHQICYINSKLTYPLVA